MAAYYDQETGIRSRSRDPLTEMHALMRRYYAPVSVAAHHLWLTQLRYIFTMASS